MIALAFALAAAEPQSFNLVELPPPAVHSAHEIGPPATEPIESTPAAPERHDHFPTKIVLPAVIVIVASVLIASLARKSSGPHLHLPSHEQEMRVRVN